MKVFFLNQVNQPVHLRQLRGQIERYLIKKPKAPFILSADTWGGAFDNETLEAATSFRQYRNGRIICYAGYECWSSGLAMLAIGDIRVAQRDTQFMLHEPAIPIKRVSNATQGAFTLKSWQGFMDQVDKRRNIYFGYLDERTKQPAGYWRALAQPSPDVHYFSAQDMLERGLLTHIVDEYSEISALAHRL